MRRLVIRVSAGLAAAAFAAAIYWSIRLGRGEVRFRRNPQAAAAWVQRGLAAEAADDFPQAERHLLEAARVDATYLPRWTLANYYFRRQDLPRFWRWAAEAGRMSHGDTTALLSLCWKASPDPELILQRVVRQEAEPLYWYFHFLTAQQQWQAAGRTGLKLLDQGRPQDRLEITAFCDRLLDHNQAEVAVETWNGLISRRVIPYEPLDPARGASITNGDFRFAPTGKGFDWRLEAPAGVTASAGDGLRLRFSGGQPEQAGLLWQWAPVVPQTRYRFRFEATPSKPPGLRWRILAAGTGAPLGTGADPLEFLTPAGVTLLRIALDYHREPGTTRLDGSVQIRRVTLEPASPVVLP